MIKASTLTVAFVFLMVPLTHAQDDWSQYVEMTVANWKVISGIYGKADTALTAKGYPMDNITVYASDSKVVAEECLENDFAKYNSSELTDAIKKHWNDALEIFPNNDWNVKLVDNLRAEFETFYPDSSSDVDEKRDRNQKIFTGVTDAMYVMKCWRDDVKAAMTNGGDAFLYDCAESIYIPFVHGIDGPYTDDPDEPNKYKRCLAGCAATFENQQS